jgi:TorA maturation chaperone TorD
MLVPLYLLLQERRMALAEGRIMPQDLLGILLTAAAYIEFINHHVHCFPF